MMTWKSLNDALAVHESFLITSHLSLDGDCVGSQLAFYWYLRSLGKTVYIYDVDPVPSKFEFLQSSSEICTSLPDRHFDVLMVLDCSNLRRTGWENHSSKADFIINIDHHRDNTNFGNVNIVESGVSATGEIIYNFFTDQKINFPQPVAEALYAAIMTDTGGFRFSNTQSRVLRACADIADHGANCSQIYERVYASHSQKAIMLQSRMWASLRFYADGKICTMELPLRLLDEIGAVYSDSEGMADNTILTDGVEVGMMTKYKDNESHFSLRSKGRVDVGRIAQKIPNGGGHGSAAGCTIFKPYPEALQQMLEIIQKELC